MNERTTLHLAVLMSHLKANLYFRVRPSLKGYSAKSFLVDEKTASFCFNSAYGCMMTETMSCNHFLVISQLPIYLFTFCQCDNDELGAFSCV